MHRLILGVYIRTPYQTVGCTPLSLIRNIGNVGEDD